MDTEKVNNAMEAKEWFLAHSEGSVTCVNTESGAEKECGSYLEAAEFYGVPVE